MFEWLQLFKVHWVHFHFLRPWWILLLVPYLFCLFYLYKAGSPGQKWRHMIAPHLLSAMLLNPGRNSWFNPLNTSVVCSVLMIVALAGPSWKQQPSPFSEDVAPLVIVLDVSASMLQQDVQPTRLQRAKHKVQDLLALRPGGQVGLIVYAGSAHSVIPLTNDADVIDNFLAAIKHQMMPRQGKFPEKALPLADAMLQQAPVPGTLLLMADGVSPNSHAAYQEYFTAQPHQLLVLGVGLEMQNDTDSADSENLTLPLERAALEKLAAAAQGFYQSLTLDKTDVEGLNKRINNFLVIVDDNSRPWVDAGYYLLFPLALLMLLWFRKGWTLQWCVVLMLVSGLLTPAGVHADVGGRSTWRFLDLWLTADQQGQYYLRKGDYKTAAQRFENIAWRGIAYYRAENFKAAAYMFARIETVQGLFNLANAQAHSRQYLLAVKTYDKVLARDPEHESAQKNRRMIQSIIDNINLQSASQQPESSDSQRELGEDDTQTADGAERKEVFLREQQQLTAEQLLMDEKMHETWMRQVQKDPSRFLSVKFQMQLQQGNNQ